MFQSDECFKSHPSIYKEKIQHFNQEQSFIQQAYYYKKTEIIFNKLIKKRIYKSLMAVKCERQILSHGYSASVYRVTEFSILSILFLTYTVLENFLDSALSVDVSVAIFYLNDILLK